MQSVNLSRSCTQGEPETRLLRVLEAQQDEDLEILSDSIAVPSAPKEWPTLLRAWTGRVTLGLLAMAAVIALQHRWKASRTSHHARDAISMTDGSAFRGPRNTLSVFHHSDARSQHPSA
ncbi:unnamed protein product [Symbiodinium pilosum]|uniref:Uncharacterized protein n=1 Tax=Symbiodinium pilosum TaxID=2952 RepID=A0A812TJ70_SYMPI|nr:unnamed protein product [Symbiodinium pilosum]